MKFVTTTSVDPMHCAPTVADIQRAVAEHYGTRLIDMRSDRMPRQVVRARQVAMYLASRMTTLSSVAIGRQFGDRDHTTVLHGIKKITALQYEDAALRRDISDISCKLYPQAGKDLCIADPRQMSLSI